MQITTNFKKKEIAPPTHNEALVLQKRLTGEKFLVLRVPTPGPAGAVVAFINNSVSYVKEHEFSVFANENYVEVARGKLEDLEVTFNA